MAKANDPTLIGFRYDGRLFIRLIPAKRLFNSTMVHEVVNRMDVFAMEVSTQQFTIIPGRAEVEPVQLHLMEEVPKPGKLPNPDDFQRIIDNLKRADKEL